MAFLPVALAAGSSLLGAYSEFNAGQYQAAIASRNAKIAVENAGKASEAAQIKAQEGDRDAAALLGDQLAAQGASGLSGGSQYYLRRATQDTYRRERENINLAGLNESRGYLQEAANQKATASQARLQSYFALGKGIIGAGQSLIGGSSAIKNRIGARLRNGG